ncbi:tumor necrosis factor receptor superfamily member 1A [Rhinoderma darwinii]|uniref:tumor necrosis factor receptor superfamily member 1A n=1 Tax=Rhinoderma darwinii TaxID=43563 RepID=UPI003F678098
MTGLFFTISLFWLFTTVCQTWDIPLQSALLIKGEPLGFTRSTHRQKRSETLNGAVTCKEDEYRPRKSKHCCNKCLAGFMVVSDCSGEGMKSICEPCEKDYYRKSPSGSKSCLQCADCLTQFGQITLRSCTTINDTVCGCPAGQYKSSNERKFTCLQCSKCENGTPHYPCTADHNTLCRCFFDFYLDSTGKCRSCKECNDTDDCRNHCPQPPQLPVEKPEEINFVPVIVASLLGASMLALVTTLIVKNWQKFSSTFQTKSPLPTVDTSGSSQLSTPLMESSGSTCKLDPLPGHSIYVAEELVLQQNKARNSTLPLPDITLQTQTPCLNCPEVLYKIIKCIPVGSWREFIRRLGVTDHVIETSEHDYRHYKEAQYAMLSVWVNNAGSSGATRNSLFQVLREMNLGGCVERIEESL